MVSKNVLLPDIASSGYQKANLFFFSSETAATKWRGMGMRAVSKFIQLSVASWDDKWNIVTFHTVGGTCYNFRSFLEARPLIFPSFSRLN